MEEEPEAEALEQASSKLVFVPPKKSPFICGWGGLVAAAAALWALGMFLTSSSSGGHNWRSRRSSLF